MSLDLKFVRYLIMLTKEILLFGIVSKPASSWIGKSYARPKLDEHWKYFGTLSLHLMNKINFFHDVIMDERWVPVSRECALLVDSTFKKWSIVWFAILTMIILIIQVCHILIIGIYRRMCISSCRHLRNLLIFKAPPILPCMLLITL